MVINALGGGAWHTTLYTSVWSSRINWAASADQCEATDCVKCSTCIAAAIPILK